jgi:CRP-like cAMP-binding protein
MQMPTRTHSLGPYERLILLKAISLDSQPPAAALGALVNYAAERHFRAGSRLADPDRPWEGVHVVVEGKVVVFERERELYAAEPRGSFGMLETLARIQGGVEARAELDTVTLEIRASALLSILEDHHDMARDTIQTLARMLLTDPACSCLPGTWDRQLLLPEFSAHPLDLVERIQLTQGTGVFAHARVDSLAEIASQYEEFHAPAGTTFWREGDPGGWFFAVLEGSVDSVAASGLRFSWTTGMTPGLFEALGGAPRWHHAVAATPVRGLRLNAERLFDGLEDDFAMTADLLSAMAVRLRDYHRIPNSSRPGRGTPRSAPPRS